MNVFLNRDVSWLKFNERVLNESQRDLHPLLERALFLNIVSSNLKEFSMIRLGSLKSLLEVDPKYVDWRSNEPVKELLDTLNQTINSQRKAMLKSGKKLLKAFEKVSIRFVFMEDLSASRKAQLLADFDQQYFILSHRMKVSLSEFILTVQSNRLYRLIKTDKDVFYQIEFINDPPYAIALEDGTFVRTDDILDAIFKNENSMYFTTKFIRNADLNYNDFFDDSDEMPKAIKKLLKKRQTQDLLRLHLKTPYGATLLPYFERRMKLSHQEIYAVDEFESWELMYGFLSSLVKPKDYTLRYKPHQPAWPVMMDDTKPIIKQLLKKDHLWHYPYDSFVTFEMLLYEGAMHPDVKEMYITIYRLAESSHLVNVLKMARKNGKKVTVILELRARFDEDNNLFYAQELEAAGCKILYGPKTFKLHAKLFVMTFKNGTTLTQVGSGNYHEVTARLYTDFAYITAHPGIGQDALKFFTQVKTKKESPSYEHLLVAPYDLKPKLLALIDQEIKKKKDGYIAFKVNAITDKEIMEALVKASQAGVKIETLIRSIQCLKPGLKGATETVHIQSIVGRFLEHSRVYIFGKKATHVYVGSSDLMSRNLQRRHEVLCPVYDAEIKQRLLTIFQRSLADNLHSATLNAAGDHVMNDITKSDFSVQDYFIKLAKKGHDYL